MTVISSYLPARTARCALFAAAMAALAGCAHDPLTMMGIPPLQPKQAGGATPGAAATPPSASTQGATAYKEVCKHTSFDVPLDVDTAYARAMSKLGFRTLEERRQEQRRSTLNMIDQGFKHVARPGAFYSMADRVRFQSDQGGATAEWMEMELAREGASTTKVKAGYCLGPQNPRVADAGYHAYLERVLRESLGR